MLRTLALVLLLANALLLAALSGVFESGHGEREPERLQRQHQPGLVRILDPQAASAALDAASAAHSQAAAAASSALATVCLEAGPFSAADASTAERSLREAGLPAGTWQVQHQEDGGTFMIYMGRYADRETVQRKLAELKRLKLEGEDLRGAPELQPGISLGRFDSQASANAAMAQMAQRGLRTARVITLRQAQSQTMLRVPAADAALRARLAGLQLPNGPGFLPCMAGATASAASGVASGVAAGASAGASAGSAVPLPATSQATSQAASPTAAPAPAARPAAPPPVAAPPSRPAAAASRPAAPAVPKPAASPVPASAAAAAPASVAAFRVPAAASMVAGASTRAALARAASAAAADAAASATR